MERILNKYLIVLVMRPRPGYPETNLERQVEMTEASGVCACWLYQYLLKLLGLDPETSATTTLCLEMQGLTVLLRDLLVV